MKKGITLQLRLTLITSLLLVILSAAFTVAGMYNLKENVINPLQITIEFDSNKLAAQHNKQLSEVGDNGINDFTISCFTTTGSLLFEKAEGTDIGLSSILTNSDF